MSKKRIVAMLLAILMVLQISPLSALADGVFYSNTVRGVTSWNVTFKMAQSADDVGTLSEVVSQVVENGAQAEAPDIPDIDGYKTIGWDKDETAPITADTVFSAVYAPIVIRTVTVNFVYADGSTAKQTQVYEYDASVEDQSLSVNVEAMTGFDVTIKDGNKTVSEIKIEDIAALTADKVYTVTYTGAKTNYTVNHHFQNVNDTGYPTTPESETLEGTVGALTAAKAKTREGFTAQKFEQLNIAAESKSVVNIYYTRNTYKLTYDTAGGTYIDNAILPYGSSVTLPPVAKAGYTFNGWSVEPEIALDDNGTFTMPAADVKVTANWKLVDTADYKVVYWKQNAQDLTKYDYDSSDDTRSGKVGDPATYSSKSYEGFEFSSADDVKIAADGSTVVNVYYNRKVYSIYFEIKQGSRWVRQDNLTITAPYGTDISGKWLDDDHGKYQWYTNKGMSISIGLVETMPLDGKFNTAGGVTGTNVAYSNGTTDVVKISYYVRNIANTDYIKLEGQGNLPDGWSINEADIIDIEGFTYEKMNKNSRAIYYTRNKYSIIFENCTGINNVNNIPFEQVISNYEPGEDANIEAPSGMDPEYEFAGWYADDGFNKEFDWSIEMPAHNVQVFAKWIPPVKTVQYHLNYAGADDPYASYSVYKDHTLSAPYYGKNGAFDKDAKGYTLPTDPSRDGYNFEGWYTDAACTSPLDEGFIDTTIAKHWDIWAKWVSTDEKNAVFSAAIEGGANIETYIDYDGVEKNVADLMPQASGLVGTTTTIEAPDIPGYVADQKMVTHTFVENTVLEDGTVINNNKVIFYYTKLATWEMIIHYEDENGNTIADDGKQSNIEDTQASASYKVIPGGTENGVKYMWQLTSPTVLTATEKSPEVTFTYKKVYEASYTVQHMLQQPDGSFEAAAENTYKTKYGWTGYKGTAVAGDAYDFGEDYLLNMSLNTAEQSGTITRDDKLVLKLYYELQVFTVIYDDGEHGTIDGADANGQIVHNECKKGSATPAAPAVTADNGYYFTGWSPAIADTVTETVTYVAQYEKQTDITLQGNSYTVTYNGKEQSVSGYTVNGLPAGYTVSGIEHIAEGKDVGDHVGVFSGDVKVTDENGNDVTVQFRVIGKYSGLLTVKPASVTIKTQSDSKTYDGEALKAAGYINGLVNGEQVNFVVTGSQTAVGSSTNTYTLDWGNTNKDNYEVTEELGTLTVTEYADEIVVTTTGGEWTYDGQAHGATVSVSELPKGYTLETATSSATATDVTTTPVVATCDTLVIKNAAGEDVTSKLNIKYVDGEIIINKRTVTLTSATDEKVYNGQALTNDEVTVGGDGFADGEGATYTVTGSQTEVGESNNTFTYKLNEGTKADNYTITTIEGTLTVTKLTDKVTVTITEHSDSKQYDGTEKTVIGYDVEISNPLYTEADFEFNGNDTVKGTDAGSYPMELKASDFTNISENFSNVEFVIVDGTLEISKRTVTLTSATDTKVYDGTALTNDEVTVGGDGFVGNEGATYTVTGSQTEVGESNN
ncbi:MAG: InlB B-repeat-containing protein, partial [Clostridia bacterium]|nr:InlB B-repeat-containing protein [Clostridia bacterium]